MAKKLIVVDDNELIRRGVRMMSDAAQGRSFAYNTNQALHHLAALFLIFRRDTLRNESIRMHLNHWDLNCLRTCKILTFFRDPYFCRVDGTYRGAHAGNKNTNGFFNA
jgi:hypothetical protein